MNKIIQILKLSVAMLATVLIYLVWFLGKRFYAKELFDLTDYILWIAFFTFLFYCFYSIQFLAAKNFLMIKILVLIILTHFLVYYSIHIHYKKIENRVYLKIMNLHESTISLTRIETDSIFNINKKLKGKESIVVWYLPKINSTSVSSFEFTKTKLKYQINNNEKELELPNLFYGDCSYVNLSY